MKKFAALWILGISLAAPCVFAAAQPGEPGDFGLGAVFGSPTGLTGKYWLSPQTAIDGVVAWHFDGEDRVDLHVDHLWHIEPAGMKVSEGRLPLYIGAGLRVLAGDDASAGVRMPLGIAYLFGQFPLEAFAELAPVLEFAPDMDGYLDGGIGIRYYFK